MFSLAVHCTDWLGFSNSVHSVLVLVLLAVLYACFNFVVVLEHFLSCLLVTSEVNILYVRECLYM